MYYAANKFSNDGTSRQIFDSRNNMLSEQDSNNLTRVTNIDSFTSNLINVMQRMITNQLLRNETHMAKSNI